MDLHKIEQQNENPFINSFLQKNKEIVNLFDSTTVDKNSLWQRSTEIDRYHNQDIDIASRAKIALHLQRYHENLSSINKETGVNPIVQKNINGFSKGMHTIVTGQQAGLFTGPIYTINKIICLLKTVKELEQMYNIKAIPIFWIASDDHDISEVDYIKINSCIQLNKLSIKWQVKPQKSIADISLTTSQISELLSSFSNIMPDSEFKKDIINKIGQAYKDTSLSISFAALLYNMFSQFGLVLYDAHDKEYRKLQTSFFIKTIKEAATILAGFNKGYQKVANIGVTPQVNLNLNNTGLFIDKYSKRRVLYKNKDKFLIDKVDKLCTESEIIDIATNEPNILSTNVLLRPLLQEYMFQPLIYIGGPSEIMYWGQTKPLFKIFNYKMPIIVLRNSYTYLTPKTQYKIHKNDIDIEETIKKFKLTQRVDPIKQGHYELESKITNLEDDIYKTYFEHIKLITSEHAQIKSIKHHAEISWHKIKNEINEFKHILQKQHDLKIKNTLEDIRWIERELIPNGVLQERILNIYQIINCVGIGFIEDIINDNCHTMDGKHYLVHI
ncbi:bacillithiol biosynthesis cysteine-adding enzyme BshC [Desulfuribacillus alkaliarsenatis]|uniref:Putative cysteine ligase BshC n=1 Tax=Desulfuribacillus alkaliarsenatis TaxID=766136 RepID=A0A1E5G009_9FIRM|nr:bacillithiol biosynthesis cysteine-adding enzyme BshC [Desulfuribacillus alkaliarsenatis]OEF96083.1 bacillithiol biosynthesis cysteine-adding enzyme BshC [Desulfuribacillus alkaliarsenatis]